MTKLHLDLETYSSVDIMSCGAYKYTESIDFEILILCYAFDDGPIITIDLAQGAQIPQDILIAFQDDKVELHAHSAAFERLALRAMGYDIPISRWYCNAVKSSYCGLPISLQGVSDALKLEEKGKLTTGKALIRYFSCPVKPTKANGMRLRNLPEHDPEKWELYKKYCYNDVEAERAIHDLLVDYIIPVDEQELYILDQEINDRGIRTDLSFAENAIEMYATFKQEIIQRLKDITGLENPNSPAQLKEWLSNALGQDITSLAKEQLLKLISETEAGDDLEDNSIGDMGVDSYNWPDENGKPQIPYFLHTHEAKETLDYFDSSKESEEPENLKLVNEVLKLRQMASKTSIKKYNAILKCACYDNRAHGLFQFYGAGRTGRWAGRLIQLQNLVRNEISDLDICRKVVVENDLDALEIMHENIGDILAQLIRTAFIPKENTILAVNDFSAIEAVITAWLANEEWRLDVFATHGMIYEASASMMFNVDIDSITKKVDGKKIQGPNYDMRQKGKVAELALGYGGSLGALKKMGGEKMGLSEAEMEEIVKKWRNANAAICKLWKIIEAAAVRVVTTGKPYILTQYKNLIFDYDGKVLTIQLPSGRKLFYQTPTLAVNQWGKKRVKYKGMDQTTKKWWWVDTYGGKLVENIVQAIARDCLAYSMLNLSKNDFSIVMHVHDEVVAEVPIQYAKDSLEHMSEIMGQPISWAPGLILKAAGYLTEFYKKD